MKSAPPWTFRESLRLIKQHRLGINTDIRRTKITHFFMLKPNGHIDHFGEGVFKLDLIVSSLAQREFTVYLGHMLLILPSPFAKLFLNEKKNNDSRRHLGNTNENNVSSFLFCQRKLEMDVLLHVDDRGRLAEGYTLPSGGWQGKHGRSQGELSMHVGGIPARLTDLSFISSVALEKG